MRIEIFGTESLGVRGLSCKIETADRTVFIDPGIALGYNRYGLLPHPFQVAVGRTIRERIVNALGEATDVVLSHYHGDHIPLVDANPYQLHAKRVINLRADVRFWGKGFTGLSPKMKERAIALSGLLDKELLNAEGKCEGPICFSFPMPHGNANRAQGEVIMTRIEDDGIVFVHASDIQLLNRKAVRKILDWHPNIVLASGPPLYLQRLSKEQRLAAWENAVILSREIDTLILDHHVTRCQEGESWLKHLCLETGKRVQCAADFMKKPRLLLEAKRRKLYWEMPVPENWHGDYARGKATVDGYRTWRGHRA